VVSRVFSLVAKVTVFGVVSRVFDVVDRSCVLQRCHLKAVYIIKDVSFKKSNRNKIISFLLCNLTVIFLK